MQEDIPTDGRSLVFPCPFAATQLPGDTWLLSFFSLFRLLKVLIYMKMFKIWNFT